MKQSLMRIKNNKIIKNVINIRLLVIFSILLICLFFLIFPIKKSIELSNERVPIEGYFCNKLDTLESIKIKLNDSLYSYILNPNEGKHQILLYRYGLNKISISLYDSNPIITDTFSIIPYLPILIHFEINKSLEDFEIGDSTHLIYNGINYYKSFKKEYDNKWVEYIISGRYRVD